MKKGGGGGGPSRSSFSRSRPRLSCPRGTALFALALPRSSPKILPRRYLRTEARVEGRARRFSPQWINARIAWRRLDRSIFPFRSPRPRPILKKCQKNQSLVAPESFQHIIRVLNTNLQGAVKTPFAMTSVTGIGRRFAILACKKAEVDMRKRAGELSAAELEQLMVIVSNPRTFKVPDWFLNRQRDPKDGTTTQLTSSALSSKMRDDFERLKKIRNHRGLRHYWGLRVKGQHTKTTGRRGRVATTGKKK